MARNMKTLGGESGPKPLKWDAPGFMLAGLHQGVKPGKIFSGQQSYLGTVLRENGETARYPATTILRDRLADVPIGTYIEITYKGKARRQDGVGEYKDFLVQIEASGPEDPATPPPVLPPHDPGTKLAQLEARLVQARGEQSARLILDAVYTGKATDELKTAALRDVLHAQGIA